MGWFGKKKTEVEQALEGARSGGTGRVVELLLTEVTPVAIVFQSRRVYPLNARLYLNATSASIEVVRSTGMEIWLTDKKRISAGAFEYTGQISNANEGLIRWLNSVKSQGRPTSENKASYVSLHLDQRQERRTYKAFQVMSPDIIGYKAMTCDLSRTGLRLALYQYVAPHSRVRLALQFDDSNFKPVEVTTEVIWCQEKDKGIFWAGMRYVGLDDETRATIASYIDFADGYKRKSFRGA